MRQKISNNIEDLNNTINKLDQIDIQRKCHTTAECTFSQIRHL